MLLSPDVTPVRQLCPLSPRNVTLTGGLTDYLGVVWVVGELGYGPRQTHDGITSLGQPGASGRSVDDAAPYRV